MILDPKYRWPAWHSDTELRAEDLIGLEAYLLTRSRILDEDAMGVEQISDWEQSIHFAWNGQVGTLTVQDIQGITPSGQPIVLAKDNLLVHEFRTLAPGASVDAWISVNNRCSGSSKLTLDVTPVVDDSWVSETTAHDNLYLGRYKLPQPEGGSLVLERHPVCRRLCAFGPVESVQWKAWVNPLSALIEQLVASSIGHANRSVSWMTIGSELLRLRYEWPVLPIPQLARRLRMLGWLLSFEVDGHYPDVAAAAQPIDWEFLHGEELPSVLAGLVPLPQEKLVTGLPKLVPALLDSLRSESVNFHAPIGLLKDWSDASAEAMNRGLPDRDKALLAHCLDNGFTGSDMWQRSVALITAMTLSLSIGNRDVIAEAVVTLDQISKSIRDSSSKGLFPAGPMAFYWIAKTASLQLAFGKRKFQAAGNMFSRLTGSSASGGSDRTVQYLERVSGELGEMKEAPSHFLWWKKFDQREWNSQLHITVAGSKLSGKSSLIRRLNTVGGSRSQSTYPGTGAVETSGKLLLPDLGACDATIVEIDCSTDAFERLLRLPSADPLVASLAATNLLILCIGPSETDGWCSNSLRDLAVWMRKLRPDVVMAIAYTKADEYGVVAHDKIRFVSDKAQADQLFKMQNAVAFSREWTFFVQGKKESAGGDGKTAITWVGKSQDSTKQHILENTEPLWSALLPGDNSRTDTFLNAYFIAADSRDPFLLSDRSCGIAHLLADFSRCLKGAA